VRLCCRYSSLQADAARGLDLQRHAAPRARPRLSTAKPKRNTCHLTCSSKRADPVCCGPSMNLDNRHRFIYALPSRQRWRRERRPSDAAPKFQDESRHKSDARVHFVRRAVPELLLYEGAEAAPVAGLDSFSPGCPQPSLRAQSPSFLPLLLFCLPYWVHHAVLATCSCATDAPCSDRCVFVALLASCRGERRLPGARCRFI